MANEAMNTRLRQGFGRSSGEDDERKQSGVKATKDMSVEELSAGATILTSRLADVGEELGYPHQSEAGRECQSVVLVRT